MSRCREACLREGRRESPLTEQFPRTADPALSALRHFIHRRALLSSPLYFYEAGTAIIPTLQMVNTRLGGSYVTCGGDAATN